YHDRQHTLDITLALARLLVGYERQQNESGRLGGARAVVGLITGLFHDVGYLRRTDDRDSRNGAEFTRTHVSRGARFLEEYLPVLGFGSWAPVATEIIHFTGYEQPFARIEERVSDPRDITVGHMLGTADMIAQMADRCYLEKCRDRLYAEFVVGGVALPFSNGNRRVKYASGLDLLRQTPDFVAEVRTKRLDGDFRGAYRYLELLFDGRNPYLEAMGRVRPAHQAHATHVTTANFKFRYAGGAFLVVVLAAAAVSGVLALRHAADTRTLSLLAERTTRERLDPELQARAQSIAAHAADSIIGALRAADVNGVARRLQPFLDDATLSEISVTGSSGRRLFAWQRSAAPAPGALSAEVTAPVRAVIDGIPQTLGTVTVSLEQAAPVSEVSLAGRLQAESAGRTRLTWLLMVALAGSAALLAAALAWHVTQRLQRPVDSLIKSAERIGQG